MQLLQIQKNGPTGIDYVFVNGKKAVEKGHEKDVFSGSIKKIMQNQKRKK